MSIKVTAETKRPSLELPLTADQAQWLKGKIRDIQDFPKPGIVFKDLTTLFNDGGAFASVIDVLAQRCLALKPSAIAGIEARGFILGAALAYKLSIGFIPIRKPGKLPYKSKKTSYELEYGTDWLEIHEDASKRGDRIVLIDDLLATGGTASAAVTLLQSIGAEVVGIGFVVELGFLSGRDKMPPGMDIFSLITY